MSKGTDPVAGGTQQSIEQLQSRYEALNKKKIQAETSLEHAKQSLEEQKREAREKYGTDDLDALREKLAVMTRENEAKRNKYQADLDRIESELTEVERKYVGSDAAAGPETNGR